MYEQEENLVRPRRKNKGKYRCLFDLSLVLLARYSVYGKEGSNSDDIKEYLFTSKGQDMYPADGQTLLQRNLYQSMFFCLCSAELQSLVGHGAS